MSTIYRLLLNQVIDDRIVRCIVGQVADRYGIIPRAMSRQAGYIKASDPSVYEAILRCFHYEVSSHSKPFAKPARKHIESFTLDEKRVTRILEGITAAQK